MINKNTFAPTAPMGWNSWDCYGAAVTEEVLLKNTDYMAEHLKKYGWEYIVCDIQWYEPTADSSHYHQFADLCMDEYGRVIPAPNRFPSASDGKGFGPIAEYIHNQRTEVWYPYYERYSASGCDAKCKNQRNGVHSKAGSSSGFYLLLEFGYVWS